MGIRENVGEIIGEVPREGRNYMAFVENIIERVHFCLGIASAILFRQS